MLDFQPLILNFDEEAVLAEDVLIVSSGLAGCAVMVMDQI
jgi:hypothetical protein